MVANLLMLVLGLSFNHDKALRVASKTPPTPSCATSTKSMSSE
jgi:hypothetical protein